MGYLEVYGSILKHLMVFWLFLLLISGLILCIQRIYSVFFSTVKSVDNCFMVHHMVNFHEGSMYT